MSRADPVTVPCSRSQYLFSVFSNSDKVDLQTPVGYIDRDGELSAVFEAIDQQDQIRQVGKQQQQQQQQQELATERGDDKPSFFRAGASPNVLSIRKFDLSKIRQGMMHAVIAERGAEKAAVLTTLWNQIQPELDAAAFVCADSGFGGRAARFVPPSMIHDGFSGGMPQVVDSVYRMNKSGFSPRAALVFDNHSFSTESLKSSGALDLYMNSRHRRMDIITIDQYCTSWPAAIRKQFDYVFVAYQQDETLRANLWKTFFPVFPTLDVFCAAMDVTCKDRNSWLVVDNTAKSRAISDCVYWFAPDSNQVPLPLRNKDMWRLDLTLSKKSVALADKIDEFKIPALASF